LSAKIALITGGGSGIGRGIALALVRRGVAVALVGRRESALAAVGAEIAALGGRAWAFPADLALSSERLSLPERIHRQLGPIDLLVNNAGLLAGGELAALTPARIEAAIAVNLVAPLVLTQQFLPDLAARRGAVILLGSMMSFVPMPADDFYSASKMGLRGAGLALDYELRQRHIRLLTVYPPGTATALTATMARNAPFRTPLASPEQVGERVVAALAAGRRELRWGAGERLLTLLHRLLPGLVRPLLARNHAAFVRMLSEPGDGDPARDYGR
jgi:short-subunit dehydrogenase